MTRSSPPGRREHIAEARIFGWLLLAFPAPFRAAYGEEMTAFFLERLDRARQRGRLATARHWVRSAADVVSTAADERRITRRHSRARQEGAMMGIMTDVRSASRSLQRTPAFTAVAVLILALGIGGSTAVFSIVNQVLLRPLPYAESGQLVRLYQYRAEAPEEDTYVTGPAFTAYRTMQSFDDVAASYTYRETGADLTQDIGATRIRQLQVSSSYFDVLRAAPVRGRGFMPDEERPDSRTAVVSQELWQSRLGGAEVLGTTLTLNGESYEVVGIAPARLQDPVVGAVDVWVPHISIDDEPQNHALTVLARLRPGVTMEAAAAELELVHAALGEQFPQAADRLGRMYSLHEDTVGGASRTLLVLLGAVGLVLLLVCVNIANLMLARAMSREREFVMRAALGSGSGRIVRQLLMESLVLGLAGGGAGVLLGMLMLDAIKLLGAGSVPRLADSAFDVRVLSFALVASISSGLLFGLLPALRFSRVNAAAVLREESRSATSGRSRNRARSILVGAQIALAFMLLVGAGIVTLSLHRLGDVDLGITEDRVLTFEVHLPAVRYDSLRRASFHEEFAGRASTLPGVDAAGAVSRLPVTGSYHAWGSQPATGPLAGTQGSSIGAEQRVIAGDYLEVMGIPLLSGRVFDAREAAGTQRRVLLSQSAAESTFPGVDAVGHTLLVLGQPVEVIGVVADVALTAEGDVAPVVYHAHSQFAGNRNWPLVQVVRTGGDPLALIGALRAELASLDTDLVLHRPEPLADVVGRGIAQRRFMTWLMAGFAALAMLLAVLGLFGVITYVVRQRRREIGIRAALGARPAEIRGMVLGQGLRIAVVGIVIGGAGALALGRVLSALVFEVSPADPWILAGAALTMGLAATAAAWLPAREATAVEPGTVLHE